MRWLWLFLLVIFVMFGIVVAALNPGTVHYDLAFVEMNVAKGTALLVALILGWLLGGLTAWIGGGISRGKLKRGTARKDEAEARADDT